MLRRTSGNCLKRFTTRKIMKLWLLSCPKRYNLLLFHFINELINSGDHRIKDFQSLNEYEAIQNLKSWFLTEPENSIDLTIIVDGNQTAFLMELQQVRLLMEENFSLRAL